MADDATLQRLIEKAANDARQAIRFGQKALKQVDVPIGEPQFILGASADSLAADSDEELPYQQDGFANPASEGWRTGDGFANPQIVDDSGLADVTLRLQEQDADEMLPEEGERDTLALHERQADELMLLQREAEDFRLQEELRLRLQQRDELRLQAREERLRLQRQEERRRLRDREIETQALELERLHDQRCARLVRETEAEELKASELSERLALAQKNKASWDAEVREELAEARETMQRTEAQAKKRVRELRGISDRSEKATQDKRSEAQAIGKAREEAARGNKKVVAEMMAELRGLEEAKKAALQSSDASIRSLADAEEACGVVESKLAEERKMVKELDSSARLLQARSASGALMDSSIETRFLAAEEETVMAQVAEASAAHLAKSEEAALSAELSTSEVRCVSLEMEERRLSRSLGQVEAETARLQEALCTSPRGAAALEGGEIWKTTEARDEMRLRVSELHKEIEAEAAVAAKRIVENEASSNAECREALAREELSFVYEQLRGVCLNGHKDLEELTAVVEEQQASFALSRSLESTLATEEWRMVASIPEGAAMEAHEDAMRQLQAEHLQFVAESELSLCNMEVLQAELWEAERAERARTGALSDELRRLQDQSNSARLRVPELGGSSDPAVHKAGVAPARIYRAALVACVDGLTGRRGVDMLTEVESQKHRLQAELAKVMAKQEELQISIQRAEAEGGAIGDEALAVMTLPVEGLTDVATALEDMYQDYRNKCQTLSQNVVDLRSEASFQKTVHEKEVTARMQICMAYSSTLEAELAAKERDRVITQSEVAQCVMELGRLKASVSTVAEEQAASRSVAEMEVEMTLQMRSQLEALGLADEELQSRYNMLGERAEYAARASRFEEEALQAVSTELARVRNNQIITDGALWNESASMEMVVADVAARVETCGILRAALTSETAKLSDATAKSAILSKEVSEEQVMMRRVEGNLVEEMEDSRIAAENLTAARAEATRVARVRAREVEAVSELRAELARASHGSGHPPLSAPTIAATSVQALGAMRTEVETLHREHGRLLACGQVTCAELAAAQERRVALQRAVKAQEESYAAQQQSQRHVLSHRMSASRDRITALNVAVSADKARLEQDAVSLDMTLRRIGTLQGELLCAEAASTTEAEALVAVRRDMDAESVARESVQQRLVATRGELDVLRSQQNSSALRGGPQELPVVNRGAMASASAAGPRIGDEILDAQERVEADVLDAMARAVRTSPGDIPGVALADLGTPQFARQLLIAQALLEEWHQREVLRIQQQGSSWRRSFEEQQAAELKVRRAPLEELRQGGLRSWTLDIQRLAKRLSSGDLEHVQLESNLLGEISRLESMESAGAKATSGESGGGSQWEAEATQGLRASVDGDGSVLARMNASLRDTHGVLCQQQQQLEDITRERDRLQAHLVMALERASTQQASRRRTEIQPSSAGISSAASPALALTAPPLPVPLAAA